MDWLIVATSACLVFSGLEQINRMSVSTSFLIRTAGILKTAGAFLLTTIYLAHILTETPVHDVSIPLLLILGGSLIYKLADRRRKDICEHGQCSYRRDR